MPAGASSVTIVNSALAQIASQSRITALNDGSPSANAASVVYQPTVELLLRELDPDFARYTFALALSGGTPPPPWAFEYGYPVDCLRLRQVRPSASAYQPVGPLDPFDPQPIRAQVAFDQIGGGNTPTKVIQTNQVSALAVYTTSLVTEVQWDAVFEDTVVRRLANPLAMALAGRPDFAKTLLEQSAMMARTCEAVDEGGFRKF